MWNRNKQQVMQALFERMIQDRIMELHAEGLDRDEIYRAVVTPGMGVPAVRGYINRMIVVHEARVEAAEKADARGTKDG